MGRIIGLGDDGKPGHGERQIAHKLALEGVAHGLGVERLGLHHVLQHLGEEGMALGLQRIEGEHHVLGGERAAVGEARLGAQIKRHRHAVIGHLGALGDEAIDRVGLVCRAGHQRIEQELEPLRRVALEDVVVEAVEGGDAAPAHEREGAALRRIGVGIGEMGEVGGVGEIAKGGQPVPPLAAEA